MGDKGPGAPLLDAWTRLRGLPLGTWMFSRFLGSRVPYSGTIGARVLDLSPGHARVAMSDRGSVRNHLGSIHAVALVNLGELASGLALNVALPPRTRGIVTGLDVRYLKKARGRLIAACDTTLPPIEGPVDHDVTADILDAENAVVARVVVHWRLGPERA